MKLEITWDNLNTAIEQLKELAEKIKQFPKDVAQESMSHISYSGTGVSYSEGENKVFASGSQVAFMEYGTGFDADFTTLTLDNGQKLPSYPGVWSDDHANTFLNHLYSNKPQESYPYNREGEHQMEKEVERLRSNTEAKAKDYFA